MYEIFQGKEKLTAYPTVKQVLKSFIGGSLSILVLMLLGKYSGYLWIMAPFGASCVLLYAAAQSPLAQPRNLIFGHLISACVGLVFLKVFGQSIWSICFSVGTAIALMQILRCVHPPAGANPLVILLTAHQIHYDWDFLIYPVLAGSVVLVMIAYIMHNFMTKEKWPIYGLALIKSTKNN